MFDEWFWLGFVCGIVTTLIVIGLSALVLFRAFNDNDWEHQ